LPPESWSERGIDQAEFFISPNVGEAPRPLAKIVSGGELSRVMLALKTIGLAAASTRATSKTLIFDEVDAGIGGRVADVVGLRLRELGDRFQVLCITHLPQIAARASTQFLIEKSVKGSRTVTAVARLDTAARVEEIGRMIGGASMTDAVRQSARDLIAGGRPAEAGHRVSALGSPKLAKVAPSAEAAKGKQKAKGESESRRRG
jgi:DNA repair protein RecN (Recombination protein N)